MFNAIIENLKSNPNVKQSELVDTVLEINISGLPYSSLLGMFDSIYGIASQFNKNITDWMFINYLSRYLRCTNNFDPLFHHTLWVDIDYESNDALVYQVGNSDSIGFFLESIMWGMNIYASPEFLKRSIANMSKIGMKSGTPVVSSPFHVTQCGVESEITDTYANFMLERDFPYACFKFDTHYLTFDDYLGSLKSKRRNALQTAMDRGYAYDVVTSLSYEHRLFDQAHAMMRERYDSFSDYRHSIGQLTFATTPWNSQGDGIVGVAIIQREKLSDGSERVVSTTIAHLSDKYPSKIISHTSRVGVKDVGASAVARLIRFITRINETGELGFKVDNLNVCCETYVGSQLTGSYTQYLRHACNAEGYLTYDFISVVDTEMSTTLKPPYYNAMINIWEV